MVSGRFFAIAAGKTVLSAQILTAFALELPSGAVFLQSRQLSASPGAGQCGLWCRSVHGWCRSFTDGAGQCTDGAGQCGLRCRLVHGWRRSVRSPVQVGSRMVQVSAVSGEVRARMVQVGAVSGAGGRGGWRKSVLE